MSHNPVCGQRSDFLFSNESFKQFSKSLDLRRIFFRGILFLNLEPKS